MPRKLNLYWANKVLRSKHFVVVTDKEGAISLNGVNPKSLTDIVLVQTQLAALEDFNEKLVEVIKEHERRVKSLGVRTGVTRSKRSKKSSK